MAAMMAYQMVSMTVESMAIPRDKRRVAMKAVAMALQKAVPRVGLMVELMVEMLVL